MRTFDDSRAALGQLFVRLAVFGLPLLLAWAALEWVMTIVPNPHSAKREQLHALAPRIDTLIMGASTAIRDIAPGEFPGFAYNLGNLAESIYSTDALASQALPLLPRLRRVIVTVDYHTLYFQQRRDQADGFMQYYWAREWKIPPQHPADRFDLRMKCRVAVNDWHEVAHAVGRAWSAWRTHTPLRGVPEMDDRGWWIDQKNARAPSVEAGIERVESHLSGMADEYYAENAAILEHLLAELDSRGLDVAVIVGPAWPTYAERLDPVRRQRATETVQRLAAKYHARYFDFLSLPLSKDELFDVDHLNLAGARRFTRIVIARLGWTAPPAELPSRS